MSKGKILIVDDDRDLVTAMMIRLKAEGYDVVIARDGLTATSEARQQRPDLVLLDLGLPAGDGYVVLDRLAKMPALAGVPVLVISARDPLTDRADSLAAGALAFLQKPVDNQVLLAAIEKALAESVKA